MKLWKLKYNIKKLWKGFINIIIKSSYVGDILLLNKYNFKKIKKIKKYIKNCRNAADENGSNDVAIIKEANVGIDILIKKDYMLL